LTFRVFCAYLNIDVTGIEPAAVHSRTFDASELVHSVYFIWSYTYRELSVFLMELWYTGAIRTFAIVSVLIRGAVEFPGGFPNFPSLHVV